VILGGLAQRLDSSYLRYLSGVMITLVAWEAFFKSFLLGFVVLPIIGIQRLRARRAKHTEWDLKDRQCG
jgi:hypothetical protein